VQVNYDIEEVAEASSVSGYTMKQRRLQRRRV